MVAARTDGALEHKPSLLAYGHADFMNTRGREYPTALLSSKFNEMRYGGIWMLELLASFCSRLLCLCKYM